MVPLTFHVNKTHAKISEVLPGLYISGVTALRKELINENRITLILNVTTEVPNLAHMGSVRREKLWLEDTCSQYVEDEFDFFADKIDSTLESGGRVLIHSVRGVSRSAALCLAYLTKYKHSTLRDAYLFLESKRPLVRPNIGFWKQLIAFEQEVKGTEGSIKLIRDRQDPSSLIPDVYKCTSVVLKETNRKRENTIRRNSLSKRFKPVLAPIPEDSENLA